MIYNILIITLLLSLNTYAQWDESKSNYYKNKYLKKNNNQKEKTKEKNTSLVTDETTDQFAKRYGKDALKRLLYFEDTIKDLQGASLYKKLSTIDKLVNRIHFRPDKEHWKKENYWATPLETIGTNHGDTEDICLLKYVLMVKVGINPKDIELIKKDIPFKRKNKKYEENVALFYFTKNGIIPLVIDYDYRKGEIYKFKDQFDYEFLKMSPNEHWDVIFKKNPTNKDFDKIVNNVGGEDIERYKGEKNIHY